MHVETFALRAWVLAAASVLAGVVCKYLPRAWRNETRSFVRLAAGDVKFLVLQLALAHCRFRSYHKRTVHPHTPPPGFRRGRQKISSVRKFMRVVRMPSRAAASCGALSPVSRRIAWMRDVLRNLRVWIARMHKRFGQLKSGPRFVAVRPAAMILSPCTAPAVTGADTS